MPALRLALLEACDPARTDRVFMPVGLAYLAAWTEKHLPGVEVRLFRDLPAALDWQPDLVGVSAVTPNFPEAAAMAARVRQHLDIPVVLGGPHITGLPRSLPDDFAAGVLGEGEQTFQDLVGLLIRSGRLAPEDLAGVAGLVFHGPQGPVLTARRPLVEPLDRIPFPKRDWPGVDQGPMWSFTSRGCPYRCRFCSTAEFWESYRMHSARYVVDELNMLIERFDIHFHVVMDDLFAANLKRLAEISELVESDLCRPLQLTASLRADLVTPEMCRLLRRIGVGFCQLGLESGSDRVLSWLKRRTTTAATNQAALDLLTEHGIRAIGSFIIGAPMEDEEDLARTYDFVRRNLRSGRMMAFSFGPLVAFPGTEVWQEAQARGLVDERNLDWRSLDIDLRHFDLERYTLLGPLSRPRFGEWFQRFHDLWEEAREALGTPRPVPNPAPEPAGQEG